LPLFKLFLTSAIDNRCQRLRPKVLNQQIVPPLI
jgi:hypothetical protein